MATAPRFRVRAVGAFEQRPGCPEHARRALGSDRLELLCGGECYHPGERRKHIDRIDVVRIRPQLTPREDVGRLIDDPWRSFPCPPDPAGCQVEFEDPDFPSAGRDTLYYARAIQEPGATINGANLRCDYDDSGRCVSVDPCFADDRTPAEDDCTAPEAERAWSSPIFVDYGRPPAVP